MGVVGASLLAPRTLHASGEETRKFLFVFCDGGWYPGAVFVPMFDLDVDHEEGTWLEEQYGLPFVASESRPSVTAFFQNFSNQTCVINGIEVPSIVHDRCTQMLLTGRSTTGGDDWPVILGAAREDLIMPHLVLSGPVFSGRFSDRVVRVGNDGQLSALLDGSALQASDLPVNPLSSSTAASVSNFVQGRVSAAAASATGRRELLVASYQDALADLGAVQAQSEQLDFVPQSADCARDIQADLETALNCFAAGLSRCAMVRYNGWCDQGWDTHQRDWLQNDNFEELFSNLNGLMQLMETMPGEKAATLAEEVTVVVCSEMGRHPRWNAWGGRDHWTTTSMMLMGAGVSGGRVIGGVDEGATGLPVALSTGEASEQGQRLSPSHIGATLLTMGGIDPAEFVEDAAPITAVIST